MLTLHHIVSDGWSMGVLLREVAALYDAFAAGRPSPLSDLPLQYGDYAAWERGRLQDGDLAFWRRQLAGVPPLDLATDRPRPAQGGLRGGTVELSLSAPAWAGLQALARREGATPFMALLALFDVLLLRYTGQEDLAVGTALANRDRREVEGLIGLFVNTVVLRADLSGRPTAAAALARVRDAALAAFAHGELPFDRLVEELSPEREPGRNPLFQALLTLQNQPWPELRVGDLAISRFHVDTGTAKVDLTALWEERAGGAAGLLEYSADLFERATAERLARHYEALLQGAAEDASRGVWDLPLLGGDERRQVLAAGTGLAAPYPREATVHALFEERADLHPERVAVEAGDLRLTYGELEARANQLAHHLMGLGVGPESLVALALPRSPEMVVALLGILKAGGAYLPLDPASPPERRAALLAEARPQVLLTPESLPSLPSLQSFSTHRPRSRATAPTSPTPSTPRAPPGRPKAVAVPHRAWRGWCGGGLGAPRRRAGLPPARAARLRRLDAGDLGPLANGGRLALAPAGALSLAEMGEALRRHRVTTLWLTAGLFHQMVTRGWRICGAFAAPGRRRRLSAAHVRRALAALPGCDLINGYGPTENTTFTTCHRLRPRRRRRPRCPSAGPSPTAASTCWTASGSRCPWGCRASSTPAATASPAATSAGRT